MATKKSKPKKASSKKSTPRKTAGKKSSAKKSAAKKTRSVKSASPKSLPPRSTLTFLTESLPGFSVGRLKKTRIQAVGGVTPYSFGISQGTLPPGLNLNYQGTLWGTPRQSGDTTIFVKVIDFVGAHLTQAFDLQVS